MIEVECCSASVEKIPESAVGKKITCKQCSNVIQIVSGEPLAKGAGEGDFDAFLTAGHGERVIGTFGRQGSNMDAVGLVTTP